MQNGDLESREQLLHAQTQLWNHAFAFIHSVSLNCAIQLRIPDIIHSHGSPITLSQLLHALPIDQAKSQCIHRLMNLLVHSKIFMKVANKEEEEEERYWLTQASRLLLRDTPFTVAPLVQFISDPILMKSCHYMTDCLVSGQHASPFEIAHGSAVWEYMVKDSRLSDLFNESMSCDTRLVMSILLKDYKHVFEGIELLVDVGGGVGMTSKAILDAFPGMKCIVLDLPHVVAGLEGTSNLTFVGADMFEKIPHGDAILLKWILHDWNDEDCVRILKKCKEAISGGRKVIIIDMALNRNCHGQRENNVVEEAQVLMDVAMMTFQNGKERNEREWAKLFTDAGFTSYKLSPALGVRSVIEVYP